MEREEIVEWLHEITNARNYLNRLSFLNDDIWAGGYQDYILLGCGIGIVANAIGTTLELKNRESEEFPHSVSFEYNGLTIERIGTREEIELELKRAAGEEV